MSIVRIALRQSTRGQFNILKYEFRLDIRFAPADPWSRVPCVIDTAAPFTIVPHTILGANIHVPRIACVSPPKFSQPGDYLGSFWYRFPAQFASPQVRVMEFRCDACQVTAKPAHHIHLTLRDIRPNFFFDSDRQTNELVFTVRPMNLGLAYGSGS
jgi:hypothetical protein